MRVLAAIDSALSDERGVTVKELCHRLKMSEDCVRDYFAAIAEAGFHYEKIGSCHSRRGFIYRYAGAGIMGNDARRMLQ